MAQSTAWQQAANHQMQIAEIAIRSTALLFDFQMQAARDLLEMQARSASVLGIPDCSSLFSAADERARRLFSEGADELVNTTRRATETAAEVNRQIGRLVEVQTVGIAEQVRHGIDQLGRHTEQGLQQARSLVEQGVEEIQRAAQETQRQSAQQGAEQPSGESIIRPGEAAKPGEASRRK